MKLLKDENNKYDIKGFTQKQFIAESTYGISTLFAILMTILFVKSGTMEYAGIVWMFVLGLSGYVTAKIFRFSLYLIHSFVLLASSFILMCTMIYDSTIFGYETTKYVMFVTVSIGYTIVGFLLQKEQNKKIL